LIIKMEGPRFQIVKTADPDFNVYVGDFPRDLDFGIVMTQDDYDNYMSIRVRVPDTYPPFELDVAVIHDVQVFLRPFYQQWVANRAQTMAEEDPTNITGTWLRSSLINQPNITRLITAIEYLAYNSGKRRHPVERFNNPDVMFDKDVLLEQINQRYKDAGYTWRYFMYYNEKSAAVQVSRGTFGLAPDTFEAGAVSYPISAYEKDLSLIHNVGMNQPCQYPWRANENEGTKAPPFTSWRISDIVAAIEASGLIVDNPYYNGGQKQKLRGVPRAAVGLKENPDRLLSLVVVPNYFGYFKNSKSFQYMAVYRKLFNTLAYIDWVKVIKANALVDAQIPMVAREFAIEPAKFSDNRALMAEVVRIAEKRADLVKTMVSLIPQQAEVVVYQPMSVWTRPINRFRFNDVGVEISHPYAQYILIKELCADEFVGKDELMLRLKRAGMFALLPPNAETYEKSDICAYLLEAIEYQARKYENVFSACQDPEIPIRSIINALETMELQGLVKNVDMATITKTQLCQIINNYLNVLLENKAIRVIKEQP